MFSVLPASLISSTYTDRNRPLARLTKNIPNLKLFPNRVPIELSQIAFPIIVLREDDRTDSFREERLGLPYGTIILPICASVDEFKCLDFLTLEFLNNVDAYIASAACPEHPGSLDIMSMTFAGVIWDAE